jgi:hypothetical protein
MKPQGANRLGDFEEREDLEERDIDEIHTSMGDVYGHLEKLRAQLKAIS